MARVKKNEEIKKNAAESYAAYLSRQGVNEDVGLDLKKEAKISNAHADTDHGTLAESLDRSGLSGSGYEEYLRAEAAKNYQTASQTANEATAVAKAKNIGGYEKYLTEYDKLQTKISEAVIKHFSEGTNFSIEDAYNYAASKGLSEEHAMYTAAASVRAASEAAVKRIISFADKNALSPKQAYRYAKNFGLEKRYLDQIYEAVSTLSLWERDKYSSMTSEDYLNYIKKMNE